MVNEEIYTRTSGVLLHISSLPSQYGIGDFGENAYRFVDFLWKSKQRYWQILPLCPLGFGNSPYQSSSAYAGAYEFIDIEDLIKNNFISYDDVDVLKLKNFCNKDKVIYERVSELKLNILERSYLSFVSTKGFEEREYNDFLCDNEYWLDDYSLFMLSKEKYTNRVWYNWNKKHRYMKKLKKEKIDWIKEELTKEDWSCDRKNFYKFVQYIFYKQWYKLKSYANSKKIKIIGDMPLFVSTDSADVWSNQKLFQLNKYSKPKKVAGCPPDYFSKTGQLWGNIQYDWSEMEKDKYKWWKKRISHNLSMYDLVRIDHFRGFESYWAIPYGEKTAIRGRWEKGPGIKFFREISKIFGKLPFIAEDLGVITDEVRELLRASGFPGMKILEFAFESFDSDYLPHKYNENSVAYTGTHDNDTVLGWYRSVSEDIKKYSEKYLVNYLNYEGYLPINLKFLYAIWKSNAKLAIVPIQDIIGIGCEGRMNVPSTVGGNNWRWRFSYDQLTDEMVKMLLYITEQTKRNMEEINEN